MAFLSSVQECARGDVSHACPFLVLPFHAYLLESHAPSSHLNACGIRRPFTSTARKVSHESPVEDRKGSLQHQHTFTLLSRNTRDSLRSAPGLLLPLLTPNRIQIKGSETLHSNASSVTYTHSGCRLHPDTCSLMDFVAVPFGNRISSFEDRETKKRERTSRRLEPEIALPSPVAYSCTTTLASGPRKQTPDCEDRRRLPPGASPHARDLPSALTVRTENAKSDPITPSSLQRIRR